MEPPIGFVTLRDAADIVAWVGKGWWRLGGTNFYVIEAKLNPEIERVIKTIADACESGQLTAAYRSITGATALDQTVWQRPNWRTYFSAGTIDLLLPLVDENGVPDKRGDTTKCTREIFIRQDGLDRFVAGLTRPKTKHLAASKQQMREMLKKYEATLSPGEGPSVDAFVAFANKDGLTGHRDRLREIYRKRYPDRRPGRPSE